MKKLHRISAMLLVVILLFAAVIALKPTRVYAANTTDVNLRMVVKYSGSYALCNVTLKRYASMTSQQALQDDSFSSSFTVRRSNKWQYTLKLEPGFYEVDYVSIPGLFDVPLTGYSQRFEVKGDQMTVYVAVENAKDPVQMPDNWLVYGEDEQDFHIWHPQTPTEPSTPTTPTEPSTPSPTIPTIDTDTELDPNEPTRETRPTSPSDTTKPTKPQEEPSQSAKIGDAVFLILVVILLIISVLLLYYFKKRRGA